MNRRRELSQERIYLKAEPSGEIAIASLSKQDLVAVSRNGLTDAARFSACKKLLSQKKRTSRARGLFNNGNDGGKGNLGFIRDYEASHDPAMMAINLSDSSVVLTLADDGVYKCGKELIKKSDLLKVFKMYLK